MILIDSLYINYGGGKILLEYLIKKLEENFPDSVYYIFDKRCEGNFNFIPVDRRIYMNPSVISRLKFYLQNRNTFEKVFCFGNLPPFIKLSGNVYTYFHQKMFLNIPDEMGRLTSLFIYLKSFILRLCVRNSDIWFVQTVIMSRGIVEKFDIDESRVHILPFYPNEDLINEKLERDYAFSYVSDVSPHKNHELLIEAFCDFYDKSKKGVLRLTIAEKYSNIIQLIHEKQQLGYPIENYGFVNRDTVINLYNKSKFVIYPSSSESFGLGIIEAIECGCEIIGVNLPYMNEVCEPSIKFDLNKESIVKAFMKSLDVHKLTKQKLSNNIQTLLSFLQNA